MEASYWPKRVSLAVIYFREITEVSIKPEGDRKRPSVLFSEYEKCYPVLIETAVIVAAALLAVTSCISSSSGASKWQLTAAVTS